MTEESTQNQKIILLVDDDAFVRKICRGILEPGGYKVNDAENGKQALVRIKEERPDLVVLDLLMPEMGGEETLLALKQDRETAEIPVIILTNLGDPKENVMKYKELGAAGCLLKVNITPDKLLEMARQALK